MKRTVQKSLAWLLSLILALGFAGWFSLPSPSVQGEELGLAQPTLQEISNYFAAHPVDLDLADQYDVSVSKDPYAAGVLSEETTQNALNLINRIRFLAGLEEVQLEEDYQKISMDAALVNALNGSLSHNPPRPEELADSQYDALYQNGYNGAGRSNIACGYSNLPHSILGYMYDSDSGNIGRVGHRRWVLYPPMEHTGFGAATGVGPMSEWNYHTMYVMDLNGSRQSRPVAWPAAYTPIQYFIQGSAWSLTVNTDQLDSSAIQVSVTRTADGKVWNFSQLDSDGYFGVSNSRSGEPGCIIFQPQGLNVQIGDSFTVSVTGLPGGESMSYDVNIFCLNQMPPADPGYGPGDDSEIEGTPDTDEANFIYETYPDGTLQVTGYRGSSARVVIPQRIGGIKVAAVGIPTQFTGEENNGWQGVKEITLPSSLEYIGYGAFAGETSLRRVVFPEDSQVWMVGDRAFEGCTNLNEITLPDSVWMLGEDIFTGTAFYNNSRNWENGALYNGNHLISVQAGFSGVCTVREGTISLADNCFLGCTGLMGANLPQGLVYLGDNSFQGTGIQQIAIPKSVTYLGIEAFADCPNLALVRVENPDAEYYDDSCFRNSPNVSLSGAMGSTTFHYAWEQYLPFKPLDSSLPKYDFNYDGEENVLDVMRLAQVVLHRPDGKLGDLDGNGRVEVTDAMRAANYLVNRRDHR